MSALEQIRSYVDTIHRRMRWWTLGRASAALASVALGMTLLLVLATNRFAFTESSVMVARALLAASLAATVVLGLVRPLRRLTRWAVARSIEEQVPAFRQQILTIESPGTHPGREAFLELIAAGAIQVARQAPPERVVPARRIWATALAALVSAGVLCWLALWGPGFLGYGTARLWGASRADTHRPFYDLDVRPGDARVRRGGDQLIEVRPVGFEVTQARIRARYEGTSKWEELPMQPQMGGPGFEFLFAGLEQSLEYVVIAGPLKSRVYRLTVVDLPRVQQIRATYRFPEWLAEPQRVQEGSGDLRAVEGTEVTLEVLTDRRLERGLLVLDDGRELPLVAAGDGWSRAVLRIEKDGLYHIAAVDQGARVRLTEDFFIEAQKEEPPVVRIRRPGRDYKASPIEEVTVEVEAADDFGLKGLELHYSINGASERVLPLLEGGAREAERSALLNLEEFRLQPGDVVSLYAVARDARRRSRTDIFFIEVQPFEREFRQSQQMGGMAGGAGNEMENQISQRQKEIIAATWNVLNDPSRSPEKAREDSQFLSDVQGKLRDQALSLARRMRARQLAGTNQEFQTFVQSMEAAAEAMGQAAERLKKQQWQQALAPEQQALRHLLRAESVFREIQVAFGARGGAGGGSGGLGRDLESLFELELDTEKNQYETGQRVSSLAQRSRELDEALEKLRQLARRQQELARQPRNPQRLLEQRWQQELLRREAERLQRQVEELLRASSDRASASQQASGARAGSSAGAEQQRLRQALERLRQATEDMRRAMASRADGRDNQAEAQRAAERLREAMEALGGLRQQQASEQLQELAGRAQQLAQQQRELAEQLRQLYQGHKALGGTGEQSPGPRPEELVRLAEEKRRLAEELARLERAMQEAARDLAAGEPKAAAKLREALGEMQQNELALRMKSLADWIRRGLGPYAWLREAPVTQGLERLSDQLRQAREALGQGQQRLDSLEQALARIEQLRQQLERWSAQARGSEPRGQQPGQPAGQQPGAGNPLGPYGGNTVYGGTTGPWRTFSAMNTGERQIPDTGLRPGPEAFRQWERIYREQLQELQALSRISREYPGIAEDVRELIEAMKRLDPRRFPGNPQLVDQLRTQLLPALEQVELRLRRELGSAGTGQVHSGSTEPPPPGYAEAVAEYFRRLSQANGNEKRLD